ncbi:unnamed protein product, partial [Brassica oleracea]
LYNCDFNDKRKKKKILFITIYETDSVRSLLLPQRARVRRNCLLQPRVFPEHGYLHRRAWMRREESSQALVFVKGRWSKRGKNNGNGGFGSCKEDRLSGNEWGGLHVGSIASPAPRVSIITV